MKKIKQTHFWRARVGFVGATCGWRYSWRGETRKGGASPPSGNRNSSASFATWVPWVAFPASAVVVEVPPEDGPTLLEAATNEDVRMVFGFFVANIVNPRGVAGKLAGLEAPLHFSLAKSKNDKNLWRRISVSAVPKRIHAADGPRQAESRPIEVHRARLTVICIWLLASRHEWTHRARLRLPKNGAMLQLRCSGSRNLFHGWESDQCSWADRWHLCHRYRSFFALIPDERGDLHQLRFPRGARNGCVWHQLGWSDRGRIFCS